MNASFYVVKGLCRGQFGVMSCSEERMRLPQVLKSIKAGGFDAVVSLKSPKELQASGLEDEEAFWRSRGIQFLSFPMADEIAVSDTDMVVFISKLLELYHSGQRVMFYGCSDLGRPAVVLSLLADRLGVEPEQAFRCISDAVGSPMPDTSLQKQWVCSLSINGMASDNVFPPPSC